MPKRKREQILAEIFDVIARDAQEISALLKSLGSTENRPSRKEEAWTTKEIQAFEGALHKYHGDVDKIAEAVPTRSRAKVEERVKLYQKANYDADANGEVSPTTATSQSDKGKQTPEPTERHGSTGEGNKKKSKAETPTKQGANGTSKKPAAATSTATPLKKEPSKKPAAEATTTKKGATPTRTTPSTPTTLAKKHAKPDDVEEEESSTSQTATKAKKLKTRGSH